MKKHRVHIKVEGRVQGVFFRASTLEVAKKLGISGNVRNLPDGKVEIFAEGDKASLIKLHGWCKTGPERAIVKSVKINWEEAKNNFSEFTIL